MITAKYTKKGAEKLRSLLLFLIAFFKKDFFSALPTRRDFFIFTT
jgi:hypothetical protein